MDFKKSFGNTKDSFMLWRKKRKEKSSGKATEVIAKLSRGLMLPIAILPIAGLLLGIGSTIITTTATGSAGNIIGNIIKMPGQVVFDSLPVLFAIAIAIAFTKESGVAGLSAFVGWVVFCGLQSALILTTRDKTDGSIISQDILFYHFSDEQGSTFSLEMFTAIIATNVGIQSLSTSVFGGIVIGAGVAFLYNKYRNIQMPAVLGFFSGVRFIPIVTIMFSIFMGLIFAMVWPIIGIGLYYFGIALSSAPLGINSLFFGIVERSLVPFGLHHAFYSPLWYTSAGGTFDLAHTEAIINGSAIASYNGVAIIPINGSKVLWSDVAMAINPSIEVDKLQSWAGDQTIWFNIYSYLAGKDVLLANGDTVTLTFTNIANSANNGFNAGQYMQGKYAFMMFGLPAAAAAMITTAPSENRKVASSIIASAAFTCFLTGITEPLEFTFLFLAPWLFWGFHAILAGISFWFMNLFGAHMGMTFSGGALDFVIYGAIPDALGAGTNCWIAILIGLGLVPIYYFGFYFAIKKFDIKTPGRGDQVKLFNKEDYKNRNKVKIKNGSKTPASKDTIERAKALKVIAAYGGKNNIKNVDACITKLRIQVEKQDVVNREELMSLGARGVTNIGKSSVYSIFGTEADRIKNEILEIFEETPVIVKETSKQKTKSSIKKQSTKKITTKKK